jgi:hypothetical protein
MGRFNTRSEPNLRARDLLGGSDEDPTACSARHGRRLADGLCGFVDRPVVRTVVTCGSHPRQPLGYPVAHGPAPLA